VILERSQHDRWLSNAWLVAARDGGPAVLVDAGAPAAPLLDAARRRGLRVTHVLATHHHPDHVAEAGAWADAHGAEICAHPLEADLVPGCTRTLDDGDVLDVGGLEVEVLHVPGHTRGQLAFLAGGEALFTGDTLFAGSVGGTRAPGHGTFAQLRRSILERLLAQPAGTRILPGHAGETTVGRESETNPFVRAWRGLDPLLDLPCRALGEPARLLTWARDYDGGHKAWVRFQGGGEDVVPGSRVERC
jgi:glyoxylase-like metal-dependent hydrolase (beta-lactamase superfamily II)